jgi:hypothetical protein
VAQEDGIAERISQKNWTECHGFAVSGIAEREFGSALTATPSHAAECKPPGARNHRQKGVK